MIVFACIMIVLAIGLIIISLVNKPENAPEWLKGEPEEGIEATRTNIQGLRVVGIAFFVIGASAIIYRQVTYKTPLPFPTDLTYTQFAKGIFQHLNQNAIEEHKTYLVLDEVKSKGFQDHQGNNGMQGRWWCRQYELDFFFFDVNQDSVVYLDEMVAKLQQENDSNQNGLIEEEEFERLYVGSQKMIKGCKCENVTDPFVPMHYQNNQLPTGCIE